MIEMASEHYRRRAESEQKIWGDHSIEILDRLHLEEKIDAMERAQAQNAQFAGQYSHSQEEIAAVEDQRNKKEAVNHPSHYNAGKIEVIEAITDWGLGFCDGNVVKYVARFRHKNGVEDLKKAAWYLNRLIQQEEAKCPMKSK